LLVRQSACNIDQQGVCAAELLAILPLTRLGRAAERTRLFCRHRWRNFEQPGGFSRSLKQTIDAPGDGLSADALGGVVLFCVAALSRPALFVAPVANALVAPGAQDAIAPIVRALPRRHRSPTVAAHLNLGLGQSGKFVFI
jgi:hypothetical protein